MKIAFVGGTGRAGSRIVTEALARGHQVTAIARHPEKAPQVPGLTARAGDASDPDALAKILSGHDVVISSLRFVESDPAKLIAAVKKSGVKCYLVVGGAGSLEVAPGKALVYTPEFPAVARGEAGKGREFLNRLRGERELDWAFLSPSALFAPGESAPANSGSARASCSPTRRARAGCRWKISPSPCSTRWKSRSTAGSGSPSAIELPFRHARTCCGHPRLEAR